MLKRFNLKWLLPLIHLLFLGFSLSLSKQMILKIEEQRGDRRQDLKMYIYRRKLIKMTKNDAPKSTRVLRKDPRREVLDSKTKKRDL